MYCIDLNNFYDIHISCNYEEAGDDSKA